MSMWSRVLGRDRWQHILDQPGGSWNLDHVRSAILDAEERVHFQRVSQRVVIFLCSVWLLLLGATIATHYANTAPHSTTSGQSVGFLICLVLTIGLAYLQYLRIRVTLLGTRKLALVLRTLREAQQRDVGDDADLVLAHQRRYREDVSDVIQQYRDEANRYRRVHNRLQSVVIVGSIVTSALTTASVSFVEVRWAAVGVSAFVGLAAGFTGYFKYRERSFNLQQTADAIEREYEAVELRVGRYRAKNEADAYAIFAATVEDLRDDQNKRQQQLDQPVEGRRDTVGASQ
jgi:Protein of unknown function (DUF4231)